MSQSRCAMNLPARLAGLVFACALVAAGAAVDAFAEFALLRPAKDSTLVEDPSGTLANGSGEAIFAGRISAGSRSIRRALIAFDVAAAVPAGSTVTGARLWLNLSSTSAGPVPVRLHRALADWGEGASASGGGGGAPAAPGDSTWIHRFYDDLFWTQPGGDFDPTPRGEAIVDQPGTYAWGSTPEMVADAQSWLDQPESAFGWMLLGDEVRRQTVKRFDSRESPDEMVRPLLEIDFVPPCSPDLAGQGYWKRQCAGTEPGFAGWVLPCANRVLGDLGLPGHDACGALLMPHPLACSDRAAAKLSILVLNVCAGRLQSSCPLEASKDGCDATTVADLLVEISRLIREGDCRRATGCAGSLE